MHNYSLIFFTLFSIAAHTTLLGFWPTTEQVRIRPEETSIEIGMVSMPQINTEFTQEHNKTINTARIETQKSTTIEPQVNKAQVPTDVIHPNSNIPELCATESPALTEPADAENQVETILSIVVASSPQPVTSPITATKAAPLYSKNPAPDYPVIALRNGWEGEVWLVVVVSRSGTVDKVTIEQSSDNIILDQAAIRAVQNWQFVPARIGSETTEGSVRIPIHFRINRS